MTLALAIAGAAALPSVHVPITVQASGIIRPVVERQDARAAEDGVVAAVHVRDGDRVDAGDTLVALDAAAIGTRIAALDSLTRARESDMADLTVLLTTGDSLVAPQHLRTSHRQQQSREHAAILAELNARAVAETRESERLQFLFARGFLAPEQTERQLGTERMAKAAVREQLERMRSEWSEAHAGVTDELRRLRAERVELAEMSARYVVVAPVAGTVEMTGSLSPGSVLQRGERVASISPNTDLIAEVLLTPRDIAYVRPGTAVRLMIDALNYREWGVVDATVATVADDATLSREQPVFRVRCHLAQRDLRLRSGQRAPLGKGMTFRARFLVADRSVLQLVFDRADDWLNPGRAAGMARSAP